LRVFAKAHILSGTLVKKSIVVQTFAREEKNLYPSQVWCALSKKILFTDFPGIFHKCDNETFWEKDLPNMDISEWALKLQNDKLRALSYIPNNCHSDLKKITFVLKILVSRLLTKVQVNDIFSLIQFDSSILNTLLSISGIFKEPIKRRKNYDKW
jgi:hypothetical protein